MNDLAKRSGLSSHATCSPLLYPQTPFPPLYAIVAPQTTTKLPTNCPYKYLELGTLISAIIYDHKSLYGSINTLQCWLLCVSNKVIAFDIASFDIASFDIEFCLARPLYFSEHLCNLLGWQESLVLRLFENTSNAKQYWTILPRWFPWLPSLSMWLYNCLPYCSRLASLPMVLCSWLASLLSLGMQLLYDALLPWYAHFFVGWP